MTARCRQVVPSSLTCAVSEPAASSTAAEAASPLAAVALRAVVPLTDRTSTAAPFASSSSTSSGRLLCVAACRRASQCSTLRRWITAPCESKYSTAAVCPNVALSISGDEPLTSSVSQFSPSDTRCCSALTWPTSAAMNTASKPSFVVR
eukprot:11000-Heterococcus_DN1.PRE.2